MVPKKIKLLILSDQNSPHTYRWVRALSESGFEIFLFGLSEYDKDLYKGLANISFYSVGIKQSVIKKKDGSLIKLSYLKALFALQKIIRKFKPDILHAHYATSYGLLGALSGFHPFIISVWGSDIYDFPQKSFLNRWIIKYNFYKADKILSTSNNMAFEVKKYTSKPVVITPFGIDTEKFKPMEVESPFNKEDLVIGTVKGLEIQYGLEFLIRAFKILKEKYPEKALKLLIVGSGSKENDYKKLINELKLENEVKFAGYIKPNKIPDYHNIIDIFVALSLLESFGVSVLEASSCEKPVVVSDAEGLKEIVENNITGLIVPKSDLMKSVEAIEKLILSEELRNSLGKNGREKVLRDYNFSVCLDHMKNIYKKIVN